MCNVYGKMRVVPRSHVPWGIEAGWHSTREYLIRCARRRTLYRGIARRGVPSNVLPVRRGDAGLLILVNRR